MKIMTSREDRATITAIIGMSSDSDSSPVVSPSELVDVVKVGVRVGVRVVEGEVVGKLSGTLEVGETTDGGLVEEESLSPPELTGVVGCEVVSIVVVVVVVGGMIVVEGGSWEVVTCSCCVTESSGVGWAGWSVDLVVTFDGLMFGS